MVKMEPSSDIKRPKFINPVKVLVVVAPYYKEIADDLVAGATEEISAVSYTHLRAHETV